MRYVNGRVTVVIPTLPGREDSLARTRRSLRLSCPDAEVIEVRECTNVGEGWTRGADAASGEFIHLAGDDLEWKRGWWQAASEVCAAGKIPAPLVFNTNRSVQSCGETMNRIVPDGTPTTFPRMPFISREQWQLIRPIPAIHYYADNWIGALAQLHGIPVVVCHGYSFTHHLEMTEVGWPDGLTWQQRLADDRALYEVALEERKAAWTGISASLRSSSPSTRSP